MKRFTQATVYMNNINHTENVSQIIFPNIITMQAIIFGGEHMKMIVVKSPKMLSVIFRLVFGIKKDPADDIA